MQKAMTATMRIPPRITPTITTALSEEEELGEREADELSLPPPPLPPEEPGELLLLCEDLDGGEVDGDFESLLLLLEECEGGEGNTFSDGGGGVKSDIAPGGGGEKTGDG